MHTCVSDTRIYIYIYIYICKHTLNPWESNHRDCPTGHKTLLLVSGKVEGTCTTSLQLQMFTTAGLVFIACSSLYYIIFFIASLISFCTCANIKRISRYLFQASSHTENQYLRLSMCSFTCNVLSLMLYFLVYLMQLMIFEQ